MTLHILHWRLGALVGGLVLMGGFFLFTGTLIPGTESGVIINFGTYPELFEGQEVLVDGRVAGRLERFGQSPRKGFALRKGAHTIEIRHPLFSCEPLELTAEMAKGRPQYMLDIEERSDTVGRLSPRIVFRR